MPRRMSKAVAKIYRAAICGALKYRHAELLHGRQAHDPERSELRGKADAYGEIAQMIETQYDMEPFELPLWSIDENEHRRLLNKAKRQWWW